MSNYKGVRKASDRLREYLSQGDGSAQVADDIQTVLGALDEAAKAAYEHLAQVQPAAAANKSYTRREVLRIAEAAAASNGHGSCPHDPGQQHDELAIGCVKCKAAALDAVATFDAARRTLAKKKAGKTKGAR